MDVVRCMSCAGRMTRDDGTKDEDDDDENDWISSLFLLWAPPCLRIADVTTTGVLVLVLVVVVPLCTPLS